MRLRGGAGPAMEVIKQLAARGIFRERDLTKFDLSHNWLHEARSKGLVARHRYGVWSHRLYNPTRYEFVQIRFPKAVFWGPSALWLQGVQSGEPEGLWIAMDNKARAPRNLDLSAVVVRTRHLDDNVITLIPEKRLLPLRLHAQERAEADVARLDLQKMLSRAARRESFAMPPEATFLSAALPLPLRRYHSIREQNEEWMTLAPGSSLDTR